MGVVCFQFYRSYSLDLSYNVAHQSGTKDSPVVVTAPLLDVTSMGACPIFG